ncbi:MAG: hypothetical protein IPP81_12820 [Chitinophagaceae bacterium]|nr:hypothetical protein [Chitinophagaceae bacterium]
MGKSIQHLEFIETHGKEIIYHYNKDDVPLPCFFYLGLIERLHSTAISLNALIKTVNDVPEMEFSIGLIVRTVILDFLIGLRGYDIYKEGEEAGSNHDAIDIDLKKYCNITLADGVVKTGKYFVLLNKKEQLSDEKLHETLNKLSGDYSNWIEKYNNDKVAPKSKFEQGLTGSGLFEKISDSPGIKALALHFEKYAMFSKYEHFSAMSYTVLRRPIVDQLPTIDHAIEVFVLHLFICADIIKKYLNDDFINGKIRILTEYIAEVLGVPPAAVEDVADK